VAHDTTKRTIPWWLADARFWCSVFVVLFWPVVMLTHVIGCVVLLVAVFGAWLVLQTRPVSDRA
jgi:uncharacterized membrane protein